MTIETLNAIKAEAEALNTSISDLAVKITDAEDNGVAVPATVDEAYTNIITSLQTILTWVNKAIEDGTVEEPELTTMQAFLAELKAVFDKYAAVIEYVSSGYGEDMGENYGGASFYRLTATDPVNGNVEAKDIVSATLTSDKLV